ncbi:MAG: ABC transporter permease [Anaerolineae bacterium]
MSEILHNILRHKGRTTLTVIGIVIGIFAITVMGSMTEYFNVMIDNAMKMAAKSISVAPKGGLHSLLTDGDRRAVERVAGVKAVFPFTAGSLDPGGNIQFGPPPTVYGLPPEYFDYDKTDLSRGRLLDRGDQYVAIIGVKIAKNKNLDLGGTLRWRDHDFSVIGIIQETQTAPDNWVMVPIDVARHVMAQPTLISGMYVFPNNLQDADAVVNQIKTQVDTVKVQTLEEQLAAVRQALVIFNAILLSGAIISSIVGGLAVINTMIMSVNERTREIGLKKAIGATDGEIIREYVGEAALIGLLGGAVGLGLGAGMTRLLNAALGNSLGGSDLFLLTPRLALVAVGFAVFLGSAAGLYPAWSAARLNPVDALRSE